MKIKIFKRVVAMVLALVMTCGVLPLGVFANGPVVKVESDVQTTPDGSTTDAKLVIKINADQLVEILKTNGLSYEDFLRGKRVMYAEFVKSFDSTDNIANNLMSMTFDGAELLSYADTVESVTFDDVKNLFETAFNKEKITLSVVLPLENKEEI